MSMDSKQADAKYQLLMTKYKKLRSNRENLEKARKYLREAQELDTDGLVSQEVVNAWRYLG